ncbi:MAG TPA: hypothetical protein DDW65_21530 [Firmicutes bacterium]|nr:hypothetical protein [Bacillota bacterium]
MNIVAPEKLISPNATMRHRRKDPAQLYLKIEGESMKNQLLEYALYYHNTLQWSVIPLRKDKKSFIKWEEFQTRHASEEEILSWWKEWPNANIGIITGQISGIVVLDIDGEGAKTLAPFVAVEPLPQTPKSITRNGNHYIFKHPGLEVRNFVRKDLADMHFRGDGGYIVAPPSIHETGHIYSWEVQPGEIALAPMPKFLLKLCIERDVMLPSTGSGKSGKHQKKVDAENALSGVPEGQRDASIFQYACSLRSRNVELAEARQLILTMAANCSPPFSESQALIKLEQAWKFEPGNVEDPITLIKNAISFLEAINALEQVYSPDGMNGLALLRTNEPSQYPLIKQALKKKFGTELNLNELEKAVSKQIAENNKLRIVEGNEPPPLLEQVLKNLPVKELRKPHSWNITENGIWQDSKYGPICACPVPVIITGRLHNWEHADYKTEIQFYRDQCWKKIVANNATIYDNRAIIQLANKDLPVSSNSSKHLVRFLEEFQRENLEVIPVIKSTSHLGWVDSNFIPGVAGDIRIDSEDNFTYTGYHSAGDYTKWLKLATRIRNYPLARFILSASFAAPLLRLLGQRVYIIHLWGPTRFGKSAALKFALSVWGDPDITLANFNATKTGLERLIAFYCDLPLGLDERQVVGDKQGFIDSLVYLLGLGKGKARGAKTGGLQDFNYWRSIVLTNGEMPLADSSSSAGIRTRALELYGRPIDDEEFAVEVHQSLRDCFGIPGPTFVKKIIEVKKDTPEQFGDGYDAIFKHLTKKWPDRISSHISAVSIVTLADMLASQWIFGIREELATEQALELAGEILNSLESVKEIDDATRSYQFFMSWFSSNYEHFQERADEKYGFQQIGTIFVYPHIFEKFMGEAGFNPHRVLKDWAEHGWIETESWGQEQKKRLKVKKKDPQTNVYIYWVAINRMDAGDIK